MVLIALALGLGFVVLSWLASLWTDYLWFQSMDAVGVWRTNLLTSVVLGAVGVIVVFGFIYLNLWVVDRYSPRLELLELGEDEEVVERFREWADPRATLLRILVAAGFGVLLGAAVAEWRPQFLLFSNPTSFGEVDPQFGVDLAFYIFRLPFWTLLANWGFNLVALTLILVAALYYLKGGIRLQRGVRPLLRPAIKAHVSGLAALLAVLRAVGYRIDAFELLYSPQPQFFGAGFTDVNARLPALQLLMLVSVVAAILFLVNIRRPGWTLAVVSVGAWLFVSVAAGTVYPSLVQRFQVDQNDLEAEEPYTERSIQYTRSAYGLDGVDVRDFPANTLLDMDDIEANALTIDNLRVWDPGVLTRTYQNLQEIRAYYQLRNVDSDRYMIDGQLTQVMVAARELEDDNIPEANSWINRRLIYTHGFGLTMNRANTVASDGQPDLLIRDVPPESDIFELDQTRVYFGETYDPDRWLLVKTGTAPQEVDFPLENSISPYEYDGAAGVTLSSIFRRTAFAFRYQDLNVLISSQLRPDSRVLMRRNIRDIVNNLAPFLAADADPYPVVLDGRLQWVMDLYTISSRYPYSQPWDFEATERLARATGLPRSGGFNYIRNSVKATVDAYDGTVTMYVHDDDDPLIRSWERVYPDLFSPASEMPAGLVDHLRYPQDMFKIQSEIYLDYHMDRVADFFTRVDEWSIPTDPSTPQRTSLLFGDRVEAGTIVENPGIVPYYVTLDLPGDETDDLSYALMQPFNPAGKPNMASFLVADSTPGRYGRLVDFRMPRGSLVEGISQVGQRIQQDDEISEQFTLWDQQGSGVVRGEMLVVPIEESLLYIQPIYLSATGSGLPEFRRVIVVYGDRIEWAADLESAVSEVFDIPTGPPSALPAPEPVPEPDTEAPVGTVAELLARASEAFDSADEALRAGDLSEYQRLVEEARRFIAEAARQIELPTAG